MMHLFRLLIILQLLCIFSSKLHVIDLTYNFDNNTTVYWPSIRNTDRFQLIRKANIDTDAYEVNSISASEHGGTHVDAPRHFVKGRNGIHEIPMERLVGRLFLVDVSLDAAKDRDLLITKEHIEAAETTQKRNVDDNIVLFYTGWSKKWPNLNEFMGTNTTNDSLLHFPGIDPAAATWLVSERKVQSVGIDTASIDYGQSQTYESHKILYGANIPGFEAVNLNEIDKFKDIENVMIYALPMKIKDGSGAPLRIVASYDDKECETSSSHQIKMSQMIIYLFVCAMYILK